MCIFRGSILLSIKTEISDSIDTAPSEVEVESTQSINEVGAARLEEQLFSFMLINNNPRHHTIQKKSFSSLEQYWKPP